MPLRDVDSARAAEARDIDALARSIRKVGVLQPVLVRPRAGRFELISGARRLAAAAAAGLTEIPCIVHQVDDARALALAEADALRPQAIAAPPDRAASSLAATALGELTHSFDAIGSCLSLLGARDVALRDRVALDLIRTEVFRAGRLVQCLRVVSKDPPVSAVPVSLTRVVEQVLESFAPECRLSGVQVDVETSDGARQVRVDPDLLAVAVTGAFGGMLALVQSSRQPSLLVRVASSSSGSSALLEIAQPHVSPCRPGRRADSSTWTGPIVPAATRRPPNWPRRAASRSSTTVAWNWCQARAAAAGSVSAAADGLSRRAAGGVDAHQRRALSLLLAPLLRGARTRRPEGPLRGECPRVHLLHAWLGSAWRQPTQLADRWVRRSTSRMWRAQC